MDTSEFYENLGGGRRAEMYASRWLKLQWDKVEDIWKSESADGKGPRYKGHVLPDFRVSNGNEQRLIECKLKTIFTYYRKTGYWQEGINLPYWEDYREVSRLMGIPLDLFFINSDKTLPERGAPPVPEAGIYMRDVGILQAGFSAGRGHTWEKKMIYWNLDLFKWFDPFPPALLDVQITNN